MRYHPDGTPDGYVPNWVQVGLSQLTTKWRDHPKIAGLLTALLNRTQDIEDVLWAMFTQRFLMTPTQAGTAAGVQLDAWGRVVGEPRNGADDPTYGLHILVRVLANHSRGTLPELLTITALGAMQDVTTLFDLCPWQPATMLIQCNARIATPSSVALVFGWLRDAKFAGVRLILLSPPGINGHGLRWDSHARPGSYAPGWDSHVTPGTGGTWYGRRDSGT